MELSGQFSDPGEHQRVVYRGHNRVYALKFQSIDLPNGFIANMYGPVGEYICYNNNNNNNKFYWKLENN